MLICSHLFQYHDEDVCHLSYYYNYHTAKERSHLMKDTIVIAVLLPQNSTSLPVEVELEVQK